MKVSVWYDAKRGCYSTNAAMFYARKHGIETWAAAIILAAIIKEQIAPICESIEYEEPKGGVLWRMAL